MQLSKIALGGLFILVISIILCYSIIRRRELFTATPVYRPLPAPYNMLTSEEIQDRDSDILREIRYQDAPPPSKSWELDYYQFAKILEPLVGMSIPLTSSPSTDLTTEIVGTASAAELPTKVWWFTLQLVLASTINKMILDSGFYQSYHPYKLLSIAKVAVLHFESTSGDSVKKIVFNANLDRDGYQNFNVQFDLEIAPSTSIPNQYMINVNAAEIIGNIPPKNVDGIYSSGDASPKFDRVQEYRKFDTAELNDSQPKYFDYKYQADKIQEKRRAIAEDALYQSGKCFGLINGASEKLNYDNQLFCESYHADIEQVGVWDTPCQVDSDCPFYQANKNYPNTFGGCDKQSGKCEMPIGIIPLGFKKYGKWQGKGDPLCYNCTGGDDKCCGDQASSVSRDNVNGKDQWSRPISPDFVFQDDVKKRRSNRDELLARGLKPEASLI